MNSGFSEISYRGKSRLYFRERAGFPRFSEVDHYGVLWNGHYVNYFECARLNLCRAFGFDMEQLQAKGIYLPVYQYETKIKKPVFPQDEIEVAVRLAEVTESTMVFDHLLLVAGEVRASSRLTHVVMSREAGSILYSMPEFLKEILRPFQEKFLD